MARVILWIVIVIALGVAGLWAARVRHERQIGGIWRSLSVETAGTTFRAEMVDGLPAPAQRYLRHSISVGTPLYRSVELHMTGTIQLARDRDPLRMDAYEILAPPLGFIWRSRVGEGLSSFSGFDRYADGVGEMRWWLAGLLPIVTAGGPDVSKSARGRMIGEAVFVPSVLLPQLGAEWTAVDDETARVRLGVDGNAVELTLSIDEEGRLTHVHFLRWNGDETNGPVGPLRFDMIPDPEQATFSGFAIPVRFQAGWRLGSDDEFAFFVGHIESATYR